MSTLNGTTVTAGTIIKTHTGKFRKVLSCAGVAASGHVFILSNPYTSVAAIPQRPEAADNVFSQAWMEQKGWAVYAPTSRVSLGRAIEILARAKGRTPSSVYITGYAPAGFSVTDAKAAISRELGIPYAQIEIVG